MRNNLKTVYLLTTMLVILIKAENNIRLPKKRPPKKTISQFTCVPSECSLHNCCNANDVCAVLESDCERFVNAIEESYHGNTDLEQENYCQSWKCKNNCCVKDKCGTEKQCNQNKNQHFLLMIGSLLSMIFCCIVIYIIDRVMKYRANNEEQQVYPNRYNNNQNSGRKKDEIPFYSFKFKTAKLKPSAKIQVNNKQNKKQNTKYQQNKSYELAIQISPISSQKQIWGAEPNKTGNLSPVKFQ